MPIPSPGFWITSHPHLSWNLKHWSMPSLPYLNVQTQRDQDLELDPGSYTPLLSPTSQKRVCI